MVLRTVLNDYVLFLSEKLSRGIAVLRHSEESCFPRLLSWLLSVPAIVVLTVSSLMTAAGIGGLRGVHGLIVQGFHVPHPCRHGLAHRSSLLLPDQSQRARGEGPQATPPARVDIRHGNYTNRGYGGVVLMERKDHGE